MHYVWWIVICPECGWQLESSIAITEGAKSLLVKICGKESSRADGSEGELGEGQGV